MGLHLGSAVFSVGALFLCFPLQVLFTVTLVHSRLRSSLALSHSPVCQLIVCSVTPTTTRCQMRTEEPHSENSALQFGLCLDMLQTLKSSVHCRWLDILRNTYQGLFIITGRSISMCLTRDSLAWSPHLQRHFRGLVVY